MDRGTLERGLERLVREHRFTIAVVVPLVGAVLLVASAEGWLPSVLAFHPLLVILGIAVMRLPLIAALLPLVDRRAALLLVPVSGYVYVIEFVGLTTGWPYGSFVYGVNLGPMLGGVPVGLPLFFLPLVVDSMLLATVALRSLPDRWMIRLPAVVSIVLAVDLVLDPGAVALGFWAYTEGGPYYAVPVSNFLGWVLSGTVALIALDAAFPADRLRRRVDECPFILDDLVSFVLLWGAVNAFYANWIPVVIASLLSVGLLRSGRFGIDPIRPWSKAVATLASRGR